MLAKQISVGATPGSLVTYLYGPGRSNEHTDQRMIAGSAQLLAMSQSMDMRGDVEARAALVREFDGAWRQVRREKGLPLTPGENERVRGAARADHVFHATLALGPKDGALSDEQWADAARSFVKEMGFVDSQAGADCAWMAINHGDSRNGNDHIHIAVNLVREDGRRASVHQSKRRTAQAGARVAAALGKEVVFDPEVVSGIGNIPRGEWERAQRAGKEPERVRARRLVEAAALNAGSEAEFVRTARALGLYVKPRVGTARRQSPDGYSVKLQDGGTLWLSPSKMDRSLGLDQLRQRYGWGLKERLDAVDVWHERTAGAAKGFRLPIADQINKVRADLVRDGGSVHWRTAARDLSAVLGAWSVEAGGPDEKYLGRASDALSKASQPPRKSGGERAAEAFQTAMTVAAATSSNDAAARIALLMQAIQLAEAIARRADAERELSKARNYLEEVAVPLRAEHRILKAVHQRETLPSSAWAARGDPVQRVLKDLARDERGSSAPLRAAPPQERARPAPSRQRPRTQETDRGIER